MKREMFFFFENFKYAAEACYVRIYKQISSTFGVKVFMDIKLLFIIHHLVDNTVQREASHSD